MSKDNLFADEMKRFRTSKTYQPKTSDKRTTEQVDVLKSIIRPVVDEFVEADDALAIQSARGGTIFISYGLAYVCKLDMTVSDTTANVSLTGDPAYSYAFTVPVDRINKDMVNGKIKQGLLAWYKSCFS